MKNIKFIKSAFKLSQVPTDGLPEVILCGRSNVGKSSFINSIFNRKGIAKTSSTPGKTRSLNYYLVDEKFYIVDLPGYGYAKVQKKEQEYWERLIAEYLFAGRNIQLAFHFVDSRHNPTELDMLLNDYLRESNLPYSIVLSKIDKLNQSQMSKTRKEIREYFPELIFGENLFTYSSTKGTGKNEIKSRISVLFRK